MRILMFSHGYPPTISGVTLVVQKIAREMVSRGHQVVVIAGSERYTPYQGEDQGVRLLRLPGVPNPFWREGPLPIVSSRAIRKIADQFQPDVIHTHENAVLNNSLMSLKWDSHPILISSCYYLPRYITQYLHLGPLEAQFEMLAWNQAVKNLNRFKHVVFCTHTHERDFHAHGLLAPTTVISNGVNIRRYRPDKDPSEDIERRYSLPPAPRILSVGRLMKDKRLDLLVRAMSRVVAEREAHLLMVGVGTERPRLEALIRRLNLEPYIHILGFVPEEDLPQLYRACSVFAIPSLVEVQSLPTLQAAVTGLPIVAANSAALPELVRHKENGLLVHPLDAGEMGDAFLYLFNHPDDAQRMGQASLIISREHDEQITFQAYEDFFRCMAGL